MQTPLGDIQQCSNRLVAIKVSSYCCHEFHRHWVLFWDFNYSHFMGLTQALKIDRALEGNYWFNSYQKGIRRIWLQHMLCALFLLI